MTRYRVTAPYITCRSEEAAATMAAIGGPRQQLAHSGHYAGAVLPESVPAEDIETLLRDGQIEPMADEAE